ncbi:MAG: hypothetical protein A2050_02995 [Candidatus Rokubacteria bacterium GWA2_73_35]|nr:MAG: hypothetical protein A2050_02995 [Candidatus Rokubacteria bacterium GWA2_73_35]
MARRRGGDGRLASLLVLVGCVVVLGGTFLLGVAAGRRWPALPFPALPEAKAAKAEKRERAPEPRPTLTFYQELTAPLASPPPPPRPGKAAARGEPAARPERGDRPAPVEASAAADTRYTIQVAAYRARAQADALRERLAAAGHAVYVVEGEGPGGVRYRVRVGTFATREAAQEAAARVAREESLTAFVTTR